MRLRAVGLLCVLLLALLAGCSDERRPPADVALPPAPAPVARDDGTTLMAHRAGGFVETPAAWNALRVRLADTGESGAEPTLGVASDGTIFVAAGAGGQGGLPGTQLSRSRDHGATWQAVGNPATDPKVNFDPWMWLDPSTDRVYNAPLYIACSWAQYSDDGGEIWLAWPHAGCSLPGHDHQKLTSGPPPEGVLMTPAYPNVLYYAYNPFFLDGHQVTASLDGGATWLPPQTVHPSDPCVVGAAGGVHVTPAGTAVSAKPNCEGVAIAVSTDAGTSWAHTADVNAHGGQGGAAGVPRIANPDLASDEAGHVFLAYVGVDGQTHLSWSGDEGATWSTPVQVSPPGVQSTVFPFLAAAGDGGVGVGYLATWDDASDWATRDAHDADEDTRWHLFLSFTQDATAEAPTWVTVQATGDADPVQIGCIWLQGGGEPCRNLLDFNDAVQHEGRLYYAYTDGCAACSDDDGSRGRRVQVAIVESGPGLAGGMLEPLAQDGA